MDFNFTCNFLTCSATVPSTEQDMLTLPEHMMSPRVRFFVEVHTASASVLCRLIHVHLYSLCSVVFVYPSRLSCSCVLSRFCLVFGFSRFLIIPLPCSFGILLPIREPFCRHTNIYSVIEDTFQMC